ncbi:hypothetical protein CYMTET_28300 [Cymbomonas tetramitiformis]|uniref:Uncharacterized protein n=1 Tax=Cymbomonas tetramitiformis TaxID=36881 RepID=A0AAE0KWD0_9CHLO|nr:hypothetical protein CYMTET_28300 [Cymbomonas tetramitiformis]
MLRFRPLLGVMATLLPLMLLQQHFLQKLELVRFRPLLGVTATLLPVMLLQVHLLEKLELVRVRPLLGVNAALLKMLLRFGPLLGGMAALLPLMQQLHQWLYTSLLGRDAPHACVVRRHPTQARFVFGGHAQRYSYTGTQMPVCSDPRSG